LAEWGLTPAAFRGCESHCLVPVRGAIGFFLSGSQTGLNAYAPGPLLAQGWGFGTIFAALAIPSALAGLCMPPTFRLEE
jgi:hypothetical protein